ncbi:hypothetical protein D9M71_345530 [compost metagenome]
MQEAEGCLLCLRELAPVGTNALQQIEGADDVRLDKFARAMDGPVHMGLGSEVEHGAWTVLGQQARNQCCITDVTVHEGMARVAFQACQVLKVARIGQLVEADYRLIMRCQPVQHEVRTYESGAAGHKNGHKFRTF